MKTPVCLVALILSLVCSVHASAPTFSNLQVNYIRPERFTDFRLQGRPEGESARIFSDHISGPLSRELARRLPQGRLTLTFTDIDLAGRYEPWRGPRFFDIRFYRDSTPLRLDFRYALLGPHERVLANGVAHVYEAFYQYYHEGSVAEQNSNPAYYETRALLHWLDRLLGRVD